MRRRSVLLAPAMLLVSLAACGGSGTTPGPATVAPAADATPAAPADEPAGSGGEPSSAEEPVDLVVMAASGGAGIAERYGPFLEEALGREVRAHSKIGSLPTEILSGTEGREVAELVAGAEVIVFYFPPALSLAPDGQLACLEALDATDPDYQGPKWSPGQTWAPPEVATVEDWQAWRDFLDREYEAIWTLREGRPTILRAYGGWYPWLSVHVQMGIAAECTANEEALDQVMREAAEAHGAVYVSMLDVFTGPNHDQDPAARGWLAEDGMHLSDEGQVVVLEALVAAGFEPSEPPR